MSEINHMFAILRMIIRKISSGIIDQISLKPDGQVMIEFSLSKKKENKCRHSSHDQPIFSKCDLWQLLARQSIEDKERENSLLLSFIYLFEKDKISEDYYLMSSSIWQWWIIACFCSHRTVSLHSLLYLNFVRRRNRSFLIDMRFDLHLFVIGIMSRYRQTFKWYASASIDRKMCHLIDSIQWNRMHMFNLRSTIERRRMNFNCIYSAFFTLLLTTDYEYEHEDLSVQQKP